MFLSAAEILTDSIDNFGALKESVVRVFAINTSLSSIDCLEDEQTKFAENRWYIDDSDQHKLLRSIISAEQIIPAIAFIEPNNNAQEIAARELGVWVVLANDIENECFREILCQLISADAILTVGASDEYFAGAQNSKYQKQRNYNETSNLSSSFPLLGYKPDESLSGLDPARNQHGFAMMYDTLSPSPSLGNRLFNSLLKLCPAQKITRLLRDKNSKKLL